MAKFMNYYVSLQLNRQHKQQIIESDYPLSVTATCKRKSLSLSVSSENDIILRCPKLISEKAVTEFLESKKQWFPHLNAQLAVNLAFNKYLIIPTLTYKINSFPFFTLFNVCNTEKRISNGGILEYKEIFVNGRKLPLIIENKNAITGNQSSLNRFSKLYNPVESLLPISRTTGND